MIRPLNIAGTGIALPARVVTAEELDRRLNLPPGESFRITGIRKRHSAGDETAASLGAAAVKQALEASGMNWSDVDCLVCASATMDQALPYNAAMLLSELDVNRSHRVASLDIGASCVSFLQALDLMACALSVGRYQNVMIVSSDISSYTTDYRNLRENGIFGDGAAAALIRTGDSGQGSGIMGVRSMTLPEGSELCRIRTGGSRYHRRTDNSHADALFEMRGRPLFGLVAKHLPRFVSALLAEAGVRTDEIKAFIPHQASRTALDHVAEMLGFVDGRMIDIFSDYGNQVGASLPTALHNALSRGDMGTGDKLLLLGTGAGVSIMGIVLQL